MKYRVLCDDNFDYMDESQRSEYGQFDTLDEAVAACRKIVDDFLALHCRPGMSAVELLQKYKDFGDDPFVTGADPRCDFSAWNYAELRAAEICGPGLAGDR